MRNKKNIVIGLLCLTLVFMGIGYSLFSSTLNITGSSQTSGTFDVKITNVEVDSNNTSSGASDAMDPIGENYAVTETTLSAEFNAPGDYITYDITVTNRGSIDAVISVETNMLDSTDSFELSCTVQEGTEVSANGGYVTFPCVMRFKESVSSLSNIETAHMRVSLRSVQKSTYTPPAAQTTPDSCFVSVIPGEINYYDSSCGTNVNIPTDLSLGVSEVTNITFNSELCLQFASGLKPNGMEMTDEQFCQAMDTQIQSLSTEQLFKTTSSGMYSAFVIPTFGTPSANLSPITKIGAAAFSIRGITNVTIGNNITEIGSMAFVVNSISTLNIPGSVTSIGNIAFHGNGLTSLTLSSGLSFIGESAFGSNSLQSVSIPNSVTTIDGSAFSNNRIQNVDFSNATSLTTMNIAAFYNNLIEEVDLSGATNLTTIGTTVFQRNLISSLTLPDNLTSIGMSAFDCNFLEEVTIPNSVTTIENAAFDDNMLQTVTIGSGITSIGYSAFANQTATFGDTNYGPNALTSVRINTNQANVSIENNSFSGYNGVICFADTVDAACSN